MATIDALPEIVTTAIAGRKPTASEVVSALLKAEKSSKQAHRQFSGDSLMGDWRLFFSSAGKVKLGDKRLRGFFLPSWIPAQISFQPSKTDDVPINVTNQITIGLVSLKLSGPAKYLEKQSLMGFDFTQIEVKILGQCLYNGQFPSPREGKVFGDISIGQLPFFAFFEVNEKFIAARGRGGGLAIWVNQSQ